jgi:uncharacterized protein YutE (UPF0331/DUF86 family)
MMTEATLDIGSVLVRHREGKPPSSNPGTMRRLDDCGIVSPDVASKMIDAARFRNVLAHTYGDAIDDDVVYDALESLGRYRAFVVEIREYLDEISSMGA